MSNIRGLWIYLSKYKLTYRLLMLCRRCQVFERSLDQHAKVRGCVHSCLELERFTILQTKMPRKLKDPGSFTILVS